MIDGKCCAVKDAVCEGYEGENESIFSYMLFAVSEYFFLRFRGIEAFILVVSRFSDSFFAVLRFHQTL